jgi:DNA-binding response OmpR family regulator
MRNTPSSESDLPLKIAIVEDHEDLREQFVEFLAGLGHAVIGVSIAEELDDHLAKETPELLILDLNLPGENGYSVSQRIRQAHPGLYILMLTARITIADRVRGYGSGADIYLTKPVTPDELALVVDNISRRIRQAAAEDCQLSVNAASLTLTGPNGSQVLMPAELQLLKGLAEAADRELPYWRLHDLLGIEFDEKGKHVLEVRMARLKKKLHNAGAAQPAIKAVWKEGYRLCVAVRFGA